ncbi:Germin-like protein 9-3 [Camellia lanceoleosa]|uniref:Germin-like protein 9-3 n=1 Tax=Camellia lanceoleosa TaxID=1840588 RepID=A0ACC0F2B2_9ERIC|nr:Germin-like protein 9-3 [Camellia lanceoleosa]
MASSILFKHALFFLLIVLYTSYIAHASDPDILSDFIIPANSTTPIDGNFFTFTGMRGLLANSTNPPNFKVTKATMAEFPALNGQSVSMAFLQFPAGGVNPPHTHPRSAELLFLVEGCMEVGFVDTANKLYTQTLQVGDMFVFPKGLLHYQYNADVSEQATAISAFGSANAGAVSTPVTLFATGIDDEILAKSFKTDVATIQKIKAGLAIKP